MPRVRFHTITLASVLLVVASCGPWGGAEGDASAGDTDSGPPGCGNGVIDEARDPSSEAETCDDAPANGTAGSLCSLECVSGRVEVRVLGEVGGTDPVTDMQTVIEVGPIAGGTDLLATSPNEARGISVVNNIVGGSGTAMELLTMGGVPRSMTARLPLTAGDAPWRPTWVEAPVSPATSARLYSAEIAFDGTRITELPYPFDGTAGGSVFQPYPLPCDLAVFDQQDGRLVGAVLDTDGTWTATDLGPAPAVEEVAMTMFRRATATGDPEAMWFARHYNEPPRLIVHELGSDGSLATVLDVPAPGPIASVAVSFWRGNIETGFTLVVLAPSGAISLWQLTADGVRAASFGRVDAGSRGLIVSTSLNSRYGSVGPNVLAIEPDGELAVLANRRPLESRIDITEEQPLAMQRFQIGLPCTRCAIANEDSSQGSYLVVATESTFYSVLVELSDEAGPPPLP